MGQTLQQIIQIEEYYWPEQGEKRYFRFFQFELTTKELNSRPPDCLSLGQSFSSEYAKILTTSFRKLKLPSC